MEDSDFKDLTKLMALGSKATFQYNPTDDDIVTYCKKKGKMPSHGRN